MSQNLEAIGDTLIGRRAELYHDVMEVLSQSTDDFLFIFDIEKDEIRFFGSLTEIYPIRTLPNGAVTRADLLEIVHYADRKKLADDIERIFRGEQCTHNMDLRLIDGKGRIVWTSCRGTVIADENGNSSIMIGRISEEAMGHLFNPLTGLWNKVKLREDLKTFLHEQHCHLLLMDIDGLASINLRHGRSYGDALLKEIAELLDNHPLVKRAYHIDHNNFVAVVTGDDASAVREVFDHVQDAVIEKCTFIASAVPIKQSLFADASRVLDSVNLTLKGAKQNKHNQLEFFSAEKLDHNIQALALLEALKQSIQNDFSGFEVYYQPQMKSGSYHIVGLEALLRYQLPNGKRVFPDEFIPILEQAHLIDAVGLWVLKTALLQCKEWRKYVPDLHISVNFSIAQFDDVFLASKIMKILEDTGMPGEALTFEITESLELQESQSFFKISKLLRAQGVAFSIDDFGTGYSNLGYLKRMRVDEIKIDRMFVTGVETNTYNHKLISNILSFAKANSIRVCCEGVESIKELLVLEGLHPDLLQGYLFSKPCAPTEIEKCFFDVESAEHEKYLSFIKKIYKAKEKQGVIYLDYKDILRETNIGLWIMRVIPEEDYMEMYADETMERIMAVERKFTPQEYYDHWFGRIKEEYRDYVLHCADRMIESREVVNLEYTWIHPTQGEVTFRGCGKRVEDADGMIILKGYHRVIDLKQEPDRI